LLSGVTSAVRGLFFPEGAGCPVCGRRGSPRHLCRVCVEMWAELAYGLTPCEKCGRFQSVKEEEKICPDCRNSEAPYCIARGVAPYEGAVREALHDFKFCGRRELAYPFGELMASMAVSIFPVRSIAAVIPVPLHENRLRERGFNQVYGSDTEQYRLYTTGRGSSVPSSSGIAPGCHLDNFSSKTISLWQQGVRCGFLHKVGKPPGIPRIYCSG
jgi:hypothetical protein